MQCKQYCYQSIWARQSRLFLSGRSKILKRKGGGGGVGGGGGGGAGGFGGGVQVLNPAFNILPGNEFLP